MCISNSYLPHVLPVANQVVILRDDLRNKAKTPRGGHFVGIEVGTKADAFGEVDDNVANLRDDREILDDFLDPREVNFLGLERVKASLRKKRNEKSGVSLFA